MRRAGCPNVERQFQIHYGCAAKHVVRPRL
jgi:hypothetical protein